MIEQILPDSAVYRFNNLIPGGQTGGGKGGRGGALRDGGEGVGAFEGEVDPCQGF